MQNRAAAVFRTETISQLSKSQKIRFRNREMSVAQYFATYPGVEITLRIRGWKEVKVVLEALGYMSMPTSKSALSWPSSMRAKRNIATWSRAT